MLENGEVSMNKLARVVSIATPENEEELAEKVKVLPTSALNTLVRDEKHSQREIMEADFEKQNGSQKPLFGNKCLYVQTLNFEIADDIKEQLNELNSKGIDVNGLLREMLEKRQEKIKKKKRRSLKQFNKRPRIIFQPESREFLKRNTAKNAQSPPAKNRQQQFTTPKGLV